MRRALKTRQLTYALVLNAAAGLLISPISWSHHWVWAAPALLTGLATTSPHRRRLAFAVLALLTFAIAPPWLLPSGGSHELHWASWQQAVSDSYALTALAALTHAAINNLLTRPKRRGPGQRPPWPHRTTRNSGRYRPQPATTPACRPAPNPGRPVRRSHPAG